MRLEAKFDNLAAIQEALQKESDLYRRGLALQMWRAMTMLESSVKQYIRNKAGLKVRTGSLLNSIVKEVTFDNVSVIGKIGPVGIPYASVHEFGHTFPERYVSPRNASVLHWAVGSKDFFSKGHKIRSFTVPARPYMRPAMEENRERLKEKFGLFLSDTFKFGG